MSAFVKLLLFIGVFLIVQALLYFGCEIIEGRPHNVERPIDSKIAVKPKFSYVYVTWFVLIAAVPFVLYYSSQRIFMIYMGAMAADILISVICYLIYPTTFVRPETDSWELNLIYRMSFKQTNCAPSMHCSMSYIAVIAAALCDELPLWAASVIILDGIMIPVSTLYTKQHVVIDAVTAVPVAAVSWALGLIMYNWGLLADMLSFIL